MESISHGGWDFRHIRIIRMAQEKEKVGREIKDANEKVKEL